MSPAPAAAALAGAFCIIGASALIVKPLSGEKLELY